MKATIVQFDVTAEPDPYGVAVTDDGAVWVAMESGAVVRLSISRR